MTRFFDEAGQHVPVTVLSLDGCQVTAQRTQLRRTATPPSSWAPAPKKAKNTSNAMRGHFAKAAQVEPKRVVAEFRVEEKRPDRSRRRSCAADHFVAGQKGRHPGRDRR